MKLDLVEHQHSDKDLHSVDVCLYACVDRIFIREDRRIMFFAVAAHGDISYRSTQASV